MDSVKSGAGLESRHVVGSDLAQFTVGGDHSSFAPAADLAFLLHRGKRSLLRVIRMLWKHNQSRIERQGRSHNVSHSCFGEGAILRDERMKVLGQPDLCTRQLTRLRVPIAWMIILEPVAPRPPAQ
jgi:hypothetical protein